MSILDADILFLFFQYIFQILNVHFFEFCRCNYIDGIAPFENMPDNLPVQVVGRYVDQDDMVMTDIWVDKEGVFFELGYEFDRAGFLR